MGTLNSMCSKFFLPVASPHLFLWINSCGIKHLTCISDQSLPCSTVFNSFSLPKELSVNSSLWHSKSPVVGPQLVSQRYLLLPSYTPTQTKHLLFSKYATHISISATVLMLCPPPECYPPFLYLSTHWKTMHSSRLILNVQLFPVIRSSFPHQNVILPPLILISFGLCFSRLDFYCESLCAWLFSPMKL